MRTSEDLHGQNVEGPTALKPKIGGWLYVVGFYAFTHPLHWLAAGLDSFQTCASLEGAGALGMIAVGMGSVGFGAAHLWVLALFLARRKEFPRSCIAVWVAGVLFGFASLGVSFWASGTDLIAARSWISEPGNFGDVFGYSGAVLVWSLYLLVSDRVQKTFVL